MRKGQHLTTQQRADLSAARRGYRASPETRLRMSSAHKGKKHTPETREKMSVAHKGKKHLPETCTKISIAKKGKKVSPEMRIRMRGNQNGLGHQVTPEIRAKIADAQRGRKKSESELAKITGPNNHQWLGGISKAPYVWSFNAELKEEVCRRDGYKCQLCGVPQAECEKKLPVHHIDYDKQNSDPVNLTTLCNSCNIKVNTNREHWMAFFQAKAIRRDVAEKDRAERERRRSR